MNTYILHADLHKELLAQNRIDPITGDAIQEGDEVVFCASCKSIFLKDTWEYLGKKHCNQNQTLKIFPSISKNLKLSSDIYILYRQTTNLNKTEFEVSSKMKEWTYSEKNIGKWHRYFYGEREIVTQVFVTLLSLLIFLGLNLILKNVFLFYFSLLCVLTTFPILRYIKIQEYIKTLKDDYQSMTEQSFLIKANGIAVCSPYGIKEVFLHSKKIKAIILSDLGTFSKSEVIFEYDKHQYNHTKQLRIPLKNNSNKNNFFDFLKALARLSWELDFPITLYIKDEKKIEQANKLIEDMQAKFTIESREEFLKKKYGYLHKYAKNIENLLP